MGIPFPGKQLQVELWDSGMCKIQERVHRNWEFPSSCIPCPPLLTPARLRGAAGIPTNHGDLPGAGASGAVLWELRRKGIPVFQEFRGEGIPVLQEFCGKGSQARVSAHGILCRRSSSERALPKNAAAGKEIPEGFSNSCWNQFPNPIHTTIPTFILSRQI